MVDDMQHGFKTCGKAIIVEENVLP